MIPETRLSLSGDRFLVTYKLLGDEKLARAKAEAICIEQTIEFPADLIADDDIRGKILGQIEAFKQVDKNHYQAKISYAIEISGFELMQFLNVLFGNSSIKPGIRVESFELPECLLKTFNGPRFGKDGLRAYLNIEKRPILCTALKPMGLNADELAEYAYLFALGGIDMIKDDHGLADQSFSPFEERVALCATAVKNANKETGRNSIYVPNITAPTDQVIDKARFAKMAGAGALMISPGLTGFDLMRQVAIDDEIALPILNHPAFQGAMVTSPDNGISHYALFGQIARLAGADSSIFPNYGGRFSFSESECQNIVRGMEVQMGDIKPILPAPGGGMSLDRLEEMREFYGNDVIYLIGGDLHRHGGDIVKNSRSFLEKVTQ